MTTLKPCKTCPFLEGTENIGSHDWLEDMVKGFMQKSLNHTCHCADPVADGFIGAKREMCYGIIGMCLNSKDFIVPKAFTIDWKKIDKSKCFKSTKEFIRHHYEGILKGANMRNEEVEF